MSRFPRHPSQHGTNPAGDALDLFIEEGEVLRRALAEWDETRLDQDPEPGRSVAPEKYDNGTLGKLLLEHAAVRLAAQKDIAVALSSAGQHHLEHQLSSQVGPMEGQLSALATMSAGVSPMSLAGSREFVEALQELRATLQPCLLDASLSKERLIEALGGHRAELHSAKYLRKHAPTHPSQGKWYDKVPILLRLHTAYDRVRGFPWAESSPLASPSVADRYDRETR